MCLVDYWVEIELEMPDRRKLDQGQGGEFKKLCNPTKISTTDSLTD